tara:strand:+ start:429 stop:1301 length:873 start_codon:yes stop_codon:yes gene_type:complete
MTEKKIKVISYYLDSNEPRYTVGAIANAIYSQQLYPEWLCEFNITSNVNLEVSDRINELPHTSVTKLQHEPDDYSGMFYRFESLSNPNVEAVVYRDCGSRLTEREKSAVDEWIESDFNFHIMHDHVKLPFFPQGCWGAKPMGLPNIKDVALNFLEMLRNRPWEKLCFLNDSGKICYRKQAYSRFLESVVYPFAEFSLMRHDDSTLNVSGQKIGIPFPTKKTLESGYVGEKYNIDETPLNPKDRISTVEDFAKSLLMYKDSENTKETQDMLEYSQQVFLNLREARNSLDIQ